jgi:hypothetical protein
LNLPLHFGWAGVLEAALIALLIGLAMWFAWNWIARRAGFSQAHAIGWACVSAIAIAAGIDSWNLFYLGAVKLESPVYARIALAKIHDPNFLGTRVFMAWTGALCGVVAGWSLTAHRSRAD